MPRETLIHNSGVRWNQKPCEISRVPQQSCVGIRIKPSNTPHFEKNIGEAWWWKHRDVKLIVILLSWDRGGASLSPKEAVLTKRIEEFLNSSFYREEPVKTSGSRCAQLIYMHTYTSCERMVNEPGDEYLCNPRMLQQKGFAFEMFCIWWHTFSQISRNTFRKWKHRVT